MGNNQCCGSNVPNGFEGGPDKMKIRRGKKNRRGRMDASADFTEPISRFTDLG